MSVTTLPHVGRNIAILQFGRVTLFDWQASSDNVRPAHQQNGAAWPENSRDGWNPYWDMYFKTTVAMLTANHAARPEGSRGVFRLEVSPEVAVQLFAAGAFGLHALMNHIEGVDGDDEYVDIPLSKKGGTETEALWRNNYGVRWIRVSSATTDVRLIEVEAVES